MFMSRNVNINGNKPRPPVPPRPNKHVLDEAIAKSKAKTTVVTPDGVISPTNNSSNHFKTNLNGSLTNGQHSRARADLGQHVHENEPMFRQNGHRRPTVLLITNGKTLVQDDFHKKDSKSQFQVKPSSSGKETPPKIKHSNWYQVEEESGRPVKYSSCQITLDGSSSSSSSPIIQRPRAVSMSALQGLPPLPKSLSGINLLESVKVTTPTPMQTESPRSTGSHQLRIPSTPPPPPPSEPKKQTLPTQRKMTTLDTQLAILRKEMFSLRELDLSLLSQLWSLNESIQEFRQMQEAFSPPSPSSDVEDDIIYSNLSALPEHQAYPLSSSSSRSSTMDLGDV
uniref:Protein FAM89A n=2 Tax=Proconiini TaxID=565685 RepID=A0A1B6FZN5_9HEMI